MINNKNIKVDVVDCHPIFGISNLQAQ